MDSQWDGVTRRRWKFSEAGLVREVDHWRSVLGGCIFSEPLSVFLCFLAIMK
jgi:hypothetical protein